MKIGDKVKFVFNPLTTSAMWKNFNGEVGEVLDIDEYHVYVAFIKHTPLGRTTVTLNIKNVAPVKTFLGHPHTKLFK